MGKTWQNFQVYIPHLPGVWGVYYTSNNRELKVSSANSGNQNQIGISDFEWKFSQKSVKRNAKLNMFYRVSKDAEDKDEIQSIEDPECIF